MKVLVSAVLAIVLAGGAQAATVATGSTLVGDAGGIDAVGPNDSIASNNAAYSNEVTTPDSEWVWIGNINTVNAANFEFSFDLTGFDVATAALEGVWGSDNVGSISLNGTLIAQLLGNSKATSGPCRPTAMGTSRSSTRA